MRQATAELRQALSEITGGYTAPCGPVDNDAKVKYFEEQIGRIDALRCQYDHEITLYCHRDLDHHFNCVAYALNLLGDDILVQCSDGFQPLQDHLQPDTQFLQYICSKLPVMLARPTVGDIAVYYLDHRPVHVGKICDGNMVVSRWGEGHVWQHPAFQVPSNYGTEVMPYSQPTKATVLDTYIQWARLKSPNIRVKLSCEHVNP